MYLLPLKRVGHNVMTAICAGCAAPELERERTLALIDEPDRSEVAGNLKTDEMWTEWREDLRIRGVTRAVEQFARIKVLIECGAIDRILSGDIRNSVLERLRIEQEIDAKLGEAAVPGSH